MGCLPSWLCGGLGAATYCYCSASQEGIVPHIANPGEDNDSNFEVWFLLSAYHFQTIVKWKKNATWIVITRGLAVYL